MSLGVAGVGKEQVWGQREGGRETDVDFMFGQGHVRELSHLKLRIFERLLLEKAHFISQCVGVFTLLCFSLSSVISGVFWICLSGSPQRCCSGSPQRCCLASAEPPKVPARSGHGVLPALAPLEGPILRTEVSGWHLTIRQICFLGLGVSSYLCIREP